jgi:hypothetical protein
MDAQLSRVRRQVGCPATVPSESADERFPSGSSLGVARFKS